jgi:predicted transcriptional regulator
MSQNIKTIHSLASLQKAAQIMRENNIKKLPVILNNEIVGIITVTDISRAISAFSKMLDDLTQSYEKNRKTIEDIMEEWGAIINSLKHYRELTKE